MQTMLDCRCADSWKDEAYAALRVITGLAFFYHGFGKVFVMGLAGTTTFFEGVGVPAAGVFAVLVSYAELLGGLAIMAGFLTHWVAKVGALILIGAIVFVHFGAEGGWFYGYGAPGGYEYPLLFLAATGYLIVMGSGAYSVDAWLRKRKASAAPAFPEQQSAILN